MRNMITTTVLMSLTASAGLHASPGATQVQQTRINGGYASFDVSSELGWFGLNVSENTQSRSSTAYLNYYRHANDPASWLCTTESYTCEPGTEDWCTPFTWENCRYTRWSAEYGYGEIDPSTLRIDPRVAALDLEFGGVPFYSQRCSYDELSGLYECHEGALSGRIVGRWTRSNDGESRSTGRSYWQHGDYRLSTNGTQTWSTANASLTVFGETFTGRGTIGNGRNVLIERTRVR